MQEESASILIVEDTPTVRRLLMNILQDEYSCVAVSSGAEALNLLQSEFYNVVLTDRNLPDMSGLDLCRAIQQANPGTAVVITSGMIDPASEAEAKRSGACDFLAKPFTVQRVLETVERALQCQRSANTAGNRT